MLLYEGKAKQVYSTESENEFIVYFKDDATAFNGEKKAQISSKGILNLNCIIKSDKYINKKDTYDILS